jgi:carboxyl-terminal processing protease
MVRSARRFPLLIVVIILSCGFLGLVFGEKVGAASSGGDANVQDSLQTFTEIYNIVEQNYAEPVNGDKAIYNGAIPGMLHALDPHSNFFDPKSYSQLREEQRGKYYGVGMTVGPRNNKVIVIAPFVGTPAYRAGIHPGDVIVAVDGKRVQTADDLLTYIESKKPGDKVVLVVVREGERLDVPVELEEAQN